MPEQQQPTRQEPPHPRLLIIGAGYAGLTLAQMLASSNNNRRHWQVTVVDRLHPPSLEEHKIHGLIRVPFAVQYVLPLLRKSLANDRHRADQIHALLDKATVDHRLPEEELMTVLRDDIPVQYRHCAEEILCLPEENQDVANNTSLLYVRIKIRRKHHHHHDVDANACTTTTTTNHLWGPYDGIVAADGALSSFRKVPPAAVGRVWLLGDAHNKRRLDFGWQRLQRGADMALSQAVQLAQALLEDTQQQQQQLAVPAKFHAPAQLTVWEQMARLLALLVALLVWLVVTERIKPSKLQDLAM